MQKPLHLLLADDDEDDRFFFRKALENISTNITLATVNDGEELISYLDTLTKLPDALFLDINMPRKDGMEALREIKSNVITKKLRVIIYSTSLNHTMADRFYELGADFYLRKGNISELSRNVQYVLSLLSGNAARPSRENFILDFQKV